MDGLMRACRIDVRGGVEHIFGKVAVLLQAYLSGSRIHDFALVCRVYQFSMGIPIESSGF